MTDAKNVFGETLESCSTEPMTGFFRDGCCNTGEEDFALHVICTIVTKEFLDFSTSHGNDLQSPMPAAGFPGLKPGDRWCLCADRWREALEAGAPPKVVLAATHEAALEVVSLQDLRPHALDVN